jgi:hypothetical protein
MKLLPALLLSLCATGAWGHQSHTGMVFPPWCCNGNHITGDCSEIAAATVRVGQGGYIVTLNPGDHRKVTEPQSFTIPQDKVRPSNDGRFYICLYPTQKDARCFFAPPPGV